MIESIRPAAAPAGGVERRALVYVLVKAGREAWQGEECCGAETP
jgi:hypothetical protein